MQLLHAADGLFLMNVSTAKSGAGFGGKSVYDAALQAWEQWGLGLLLLSLGCVALHKGLYSV